MNELNSEKIKIPYPICPLNIYFKGDEHKCDPLKCDFNTETRSCSTACKISNYTVTFSYTINIEAETKEDAEKEAMKRWDEDAPRTDEMNIEIEEKDE